MARVLRRLQLMVINDRCGGGIGYAKTGYRESLDEIAQKREPYIPLAVH